MRTALLTTLFLLFISSAWAQTTYYWVGGTTATGGASGGWNIGTNWNTELDGSGTSRTATTTDILVFDGTNIGGATPTTGAVSVDATSQTFAVLRLQNGAVVNLSRFGTTGTTTYSQVLKVNVGKASLQLYPNPAGNVLNLTGVPAGANLRITNLAGVEVMRYRSATTATAFPLWVQQLTPGMYVVQVMDGEQQVSAVFQKR